MFSKSSDVFLLFSHCFSFNLSTTKTTHSLRELLNVHDVHGFRLFAHDEKHGTRWIGFKM